ncbi:alpha/beta hydrolase [Marinomonas sp. S3726]|uniref:alpha/beta hydrolase family protein n=1 Tax=Marinomonas sp. S3726 TaxID=579484 RepID=UPI0005FA4076|nr:alpha/beta hydrolase [Marinomonas sp. S3726]KJZ10785.1 alpha/beta hydrolase [Marinomonas sp. S3726]
MMDTRILETTAGHTITAQIFSPLGESKGVCIIATATGVAQHLYNDFANWLTEHNYTAVTFDYDGIGQSIDRHVKYSKSDKLSWAKHDCPTVLNFVKQTYPEQKITWIGHSVGAHMLGFMEDTNAIDKAITVGAGTGTWWYNAKPTKRAVWFLWYFLVPIVVPLMGYFPGDKLKVMCDLPKGVIMQWRRWCLKEDYAIGYEGDWLRERFANTKMPITAFAFSDDDMMSMKNITMLHSFFTGSKQSMVKITPSDVGQKRIGHIGWHKERYRTLWDKYFLNALES